VIFRIFAGRGRRGLQPSEQAILNDTFPLEKRGMAFAVYGLAVVVAPTIGPWLGGWITDNFRGDGFFTSTCRWNLSLLLTSFLVSDPPYMKKANVKADSGSTTSDWVDQPGPGEHAIILDKGQREDGFRRISSASFSRSCSSV